jgi:hypothetical protein
MYHVPSTQHYRDPARRQLPITGGLRGALEGFILAMALGAALGVWNIIEIFLFDPPSSTWGFSEYVSWLWLMPQWMIVVGLCGGLPAAIVGLVSGKAIGEKLRRLPACTAGQARQIGYLTARAGVLILHLIAAPIGWLAGRDTSDFSGELLGFGLLFWLFCLLYLVGAGLFAARLNQRYPPSPAPKPARL